jgi:hypothetical protein
MAAPSTLNEEEAAGKVIDELESEDFKLMDKEEVSQIAVMDPQEPILDVAIPESLDVKGPSHR